MRFLKKYWLEIATFLDLELFLWSATRRYWNKPAERGAEVALNVALSVSGVLLVPLIWRLSKKWRRETARRMRELSRRLLRHLSERVMHLLERIQQRLGRTAGDLLGGRTRVEFDLYGDRERKKRRRRTSWKQLDGEREKLRWLYAGMVESKLRQGAVILPAETPRQIAARKDCTPEQVELIERYTACRYDIRTDPPEGEADRWRAHHG